MSDEERIRAIRDRLIQEGEDLVRKGNEKLAAAENANQLLKSLYPFAPAEMPRVKSKSIRRTRKNNGRSTASGAGWTDYLNECLEPQKGISLDDLVEVAQAAGKWETLDSKSIRTRLRVTLHALKQREQVRQDGDLWFSAHERNSNTSMRTE